MCTLLLLQLLAGASVSSAARGAAPGCFSVPTWNTSDVQVRSGIVYGSAYNNFTKREQQLTLDLYTPPVSDTRTRRPAFVLVHGGAFVGGSSTSDGEPDLARALVTHGFVVASINYRLTGSYWGVEKYFPGSGGTCCPGTQSDQYAFDGAHDAKAAVRFLRLRAGDWAIDPDRIGMGGDSAGAFTTLFASYVRGVGEGSSGTPGVNSSVAVALSISGELAMYHMCKSIVDANTTHPKVSNCVQGSWNHTDDIGWPAPGSMVQQPPLCMVHGTADTTVPYQQALRMQARAEQTGLANRMITILGGGHVPMAQLLQEPENMGALLDFVSDAMRLEEVPYECPGRIH